MIARIVDGCESGVLALWVLALWVLALWVLALWVLALWGTATLSVNRPGARLAARCLQGLFDTREVFLWIQLGLETVDTRLGAGKTRVAC
jgi:hypothetical protein